VLMGGGKVGRGRLPTGGGRRDADPPTARDGFSVLVVVASLSLWTARRYGVIDIRVWQLLYALGEVTKKSGGVGFNFNNWYQFLMKLRYFAKQLGVGARDIERSLFFAHQANQKGTLYQRPRKRMNRRPRSK